MTDLVERLRKIAHLTADAGLLTNSMMPKAEQHITWEAAEEIERLLQALADAHGLLISYEKVAEQFEDLKHDTELHFLAFREGSLAPTTDAPET